MTTMFGWATILLIFLVRFRDAQRDGEPITCHAGTFAPDQPAAITCNLHAVNTTGASINLVRYPPGASAYDSGTNILVCNWEKAKQHHHCTVEAGYLFDHINRDTLTVKVAAVGNKHAGLHMCFLVPPDETDPHACELIVNGTALEPPKQGGVIIIAIFLGTALAFAILFAVLFVVYFKRDRRRRYRDKRPNDYAKLVQMLPIAANTKETQPYSIPLEPMAPFQQEKIEDLIKGFRMSDEHLGNIMKLFQAELTAPPEGLKRKSSMLPTVLKHPPNGKETGEVLVVNLSSRWLRVLLVNIEVGCDLVTYEIPTSVRMGRCTQLFDFISGRIKMFLTSLGRPNEKLDLAFVFSFPLKYEEEGDLTKVHATRLNKGFCCADVVNKNIGKLLEQALRKKSCNLHIKAVVNDAVGILVSGAQEDPMCKISFVLGHGVNACFLHEEENKQNANTTKEGNKKVIIDTECGGLGEGDSLSQYRTEFDEEIDTNSTNPNEQILEKMISKLYLGGIVRVVLYRLIQEGLLFKSFYSELAAFNEKGGFSTEHVLLIESDTSEGFLVTRQVLQGLKVEKCSEDDCKTVHYVCQVVVERAAYLAAAALATLIKHVNLDHVTVVIEGFLYESHPRFKALVEAKARELTVREHRFQVNFITTEDGSSKGAARIVAAVNASMTRPV